MAEQGRRRCIKLLNKVGGRPALLTSVTGALLRHRASNWRELGQLGLALIGVRGSRAQSCPVPWHELIEE